MVAGMRWSKAAIPVVRWRERGGESGGRLGREISSLQREEATVVGALEQGGSRSGRKQAPCERESEQSREARGERREAGGPSELFRQ